MRCNANEDYIRYSPHIRRWRYRSWKRFIGILTAVRYQHRESEPKVREHWTIHLLTVWHRESRGLAKSVRFVFHGRCKLPDAAVQAELRTRIKFTQCEVQLVGRIKD